MRRVTEEEISDLRAKLVVATPRPWASRREWEQGDPGVWVTSVADEPGPRPLVYADEDVPLSEADADAACAAVNLAGALATEVLALRRTDDPELDATDGAHPAWWRGQAAGVDSVCSALASILMGERPVGEAAQPLQTLRDGIWNLREKFRIISECVNDLAKVDPMTASWIRGYCELEKVESSILGQILPIADRGKHKSRCPRCHVISTEKVAAHTAGCLNQRTVPPFALTPPFDPDQEPTCLHESDLAGVCKRCGARVLPRTV